MGEPNADTICLYIEPGRDIKEELTNFSKEHDVKIGIVINGVGLLQNATLRVLGTTKLLNLAGPIELLNASGEIKKWNSEIWTNVNIIIGKGGKVYAGKLCSDCVAMEPEGVTVFLLKSLGLLPFDPNEL